MATGTTTITAEAFAEMHELEDHAELVRGEIVVSPMPSFGHGQICAAIARIVGNFVVENDLGTVLSNDTGVVTERGPDTVRGADVSFYSYEVVPKGEKPYPYAAKPPELVFEVRSPSQSWPEMHRKVAEYLDVGVKVVCIVDGSTKKVVVHHADRPSETLDADAELRLPGLLDGFATPIAEFFV